MVAQGRSMLIQYYRGSQVPSSVIETVRDYLSSTNVQMGGTYPVGKEASDRYAAGYAAAAKFINAKQGEVVLGASTSQLMHNLSTALTFPAGSEIILSKLDHEANIAPWCRAAKARGLTVKWWTSNDALNPVLTPQSLKPLLSSKTRLVACTHTSNLLGGIHDIKAIAKIVHSVKGALLCVDGVAYAPHRQIDVKDLGVDIYAFSWYKVYGPHLSMLYVSSSVHPQIGSLAHYFNPQTTLDEKLGLAAASYELVAAIPAIASYFGKDSKAAWSAITQHEENLQKMLLKYLTSRPDLYVVYGPTTYDGNVRVPVISFTVKNWESSDVVKAVEKVDARFGFKYGHFYSKRLVDDVLKLGEEGVVRVSLVHYNTEEEVKEYIRVLSSMVERKSGSSGTGNGQGRLKASL